MQSEKKIVTNFKVTLNEASEIKTSQRKRWVSQSDERDGTHTQRNTEQKINAQIAIFMFNGGCADKNKFYLES